MLGMGSGQPNRLESLRIAFWKAREEANGAALASDAFFPFARNDAVEEACQNGIGVIAEPGGSIRDKDTVDCCNKYGVSLVFTNYTLAIDIWSIGCIFAELLTGKPLFPRKNVVHQLDLMTDLLGTPLAEAIGRVRNEKGRRYLSSMRRKKPVPFSQKFPNADPLPLRLLERMLAFEPKDRPTAEEYTPAIDSWSIGSIFAELLTGKPLFPRKNVVHQLDLMTDLLGTPSAEAIGRVHNEKARRYLSSMRRKKPVPFSEISK